MSLLASSKRTAARALSASGELEGGREAPPSSIAELEGGREAPPWSMGELEGGREAPPSSRSPAQDDAIGQQARTVVSDAARIARVRMAKGLAEGATVTFVTASAPPVESKSAVVAGAGELKG